MLKVDAPVAAAPGASGVALDSAHLSQCILVRGHRGCTALSSCEEEGTCGGHRDIEEAERFVFPSCNGGCKKNVEQVKCCF